MKNKLFRQAKKSTVCCVLVLGMLSMASMLFAVDEEAQKEKHTPEWVTSPDTQVKVIATVDRDTVGIGDKIRYTITVKTQKNIEIKLPEFGENLAGFAVKDFGKKEHPFFKRKTIREWFVLDTYVTGEYTIPPAYIQYKLPDAEGEKEDEGWQEIATPEVTVTVESALDNAHTETDIRDIKNPLFFPSRVIWIIIVGVSVLVLALLGGGIWYLKQHHQIFVAPPPRPAHEIAYEALETLKQKEYIAERKIKEYFSELSLIVREYLENRFFIRAPEMTTEEFLITVRDAKVLQYEHKSLLKDFLEKSDMIKFAQYGPTADEIKQSLDAAYRLIDETKEKEEEEAKNEQTNDDL